MEVLGYIAEVVSVISIAGHFFQHHLSKTRDAYMAGFLHGSKPLAEAGAEGEVLPPYVWGQQVLQINDMLGRIDPPKKTKPAA